MSSLLRDIRLSLRSLGRSPGFTIAAGLTLALAIGANTAIFSAVHGVLLRPLAYPDADRLAVVWLTNEMEGLDRDVSTYPNFGAWREQSRALESLAAFTTRSAVVTEGQDPVEVRGGWVTGDFFGVLRTGAALGRAISPADTVPGDHRVVVLSDGLWTRAFGADASVIGQTMPIGPETHEIIGVMPPGFAYPAQAEFWIPLARTDGIANLMESASYWLQVVGRVQGEVPLQQTEAELDGILRRMGEAGTAMPEGVGVFVEPLRDTIVGDVRPALLLLLGAVGFVLLIACANIANLLLARGAAREREMAVRAALGASGGRLARHALTESVVLAGIGGMIGLLLAGWGTSALVAASPPDVPRIDSVGMNGRVAAFATLLTLGTGLVFGLGPALQARGARFTAALREGGRGGSGTRVNRVRPLLVTGQIALALILLMGAGLLTRSFASLQAVDAGFTTERVLSFRVAPGSARHPEPEHVRDFHQSFLARLRVLNGVESATSTSTLLLSRLPNMGPIAVAGREPGQEGEQAASVTQDFIDHGYFRAVGTPIVRGREFGPEDTADGPPVVIVNETMARRYFSDEDPVGQRFTWGNPTNENANWLTIVGVAADARRTGPGEPVRAEAFLSTVQFPQRGAEYLVRTSGDPIALVPAVRETLRELDPTLPIAQLRTLEGAFAEALATRRFVLLLLAGFSGVAVLLAAVGIYGVLSFLVAQRTREVGIRIALGADRRQVLGLVLRQGMTQVVPGLALGVGGALALAGLIRSQLFGVGPTDPLTLAVVTLLLLAVALLASWLPARRAAAVEPMVALRAE